MCQVPHPRPRLPAKALRPGVRERTRGGCGCRPGAFSPNLESDEPPARQGPRARGHLTHRHTRLQEVDAFAPLPREALGTETRVAESRAGLEAAATPGMRKGRGRGEIKGALAWSNLSQHHAQALARWGAEPWDPGGRAATPGAGWLLGGQEVRPAAVAAPGPASLAWGLPEAAEPAA